jgi:hypothetical protein
MVIGNLDLIRVAATPRETDSPLVVDMNASLDGQTRGLTEMPSSSDC